ncbi:LysR family transcriptional regulator [Novosphingobium flavum]|uniref:LysR family transcriptional regulator n=1 Tax=Novosphingobium flavum TaxID=1778672 RepID=A0A7X1KM08_9SPHN|nr:LysR family transcriptional regulator [Novosphingobium flavum]MBC2666134.1 LysR family transcriptional regulator [Novosphingobium flavum]
MSLQHLRTFVEVYRQRSISAAARNLGLTQPAVSQQVAALEASLERTLFERHARGVVPTLTADDLAASLGDSLDLAEAALYSARARSSDMRGAVRLIGIGDFLADIVAPRLLAPLRAGHRVHLQSGDREDVRTGLLEGHHDLGIVGVPVQDRRLRGALLHEEPIRLVASPAAMSRITAAADLASGLIAEPFLAYSLERPLADQWLTANRLSLPLPAPALIGLDLRCLRGMLLRDFGWTVLPGYQCSEEIAQGSLIELPPPVVRPVQGYYLAWTPAALRRPRVAAIRQALLDSRDEPAPTGAPKMT